MLKRILFWGTVTFTASLIIFTLSSFIPLFMKILIFIVISISSSIALSSIFSRYNIKNTIPKLFFNNEIINSSQDSYDEYLLEEVYTYLKAILIYGSISAIIATITQIIAIKFISYAILTLAIGIITELFDKTVFIAWHTHQNRSESSFNLTDSANEPLINPALQPAFRGKKFRNLDSRSSVFSNE